MQETAGVAVEGWKEGTDLEDVEFAKLWKSKGVKRVIFTDIARGWDVEWP
ncbi:MAG: HisA/HisF-related TIM barrel protein [bacterium]